MSLRHAVGQRDFKVTIILTTLTAVISLLAVSHGSFNVARGKPTKQIDTYSDTIRTYSRLAVDGLTDLANDGCTHTKAYVRTWWMVDFLRDYIIQAVNITNREPDYIRLQKFKVHVSMINPLKFPDFPNKLPGELCFYRDPPIPPKASELINCNKPVTGRYLTVFKPADNVLAICELEAIAEDVPDKSLQFHSLPNKKLSDPPFALFRNVRSVLECTSRCAQVKNGTPTAVQFKRNDGTCECIQFSELNSSVSSIPDNPDWRLYMSKSN